MECYSNIQYQYFNTNTNLNQNVHLNKNLTVWKQKQKCLQKTQVKSLKKVVKDVYSFIRQMLRSCTFVIMVLQNLKYLC